MARRSKHTTALDFSIVGDDLEHHRIRLENDLQQTEHSFHLSSTPDIASQDGDHQSLEYPRHAPQPINDFPSFTHRSLEYFDEEQSQMHPWSYRTADDEDGANPYAGESLGGRGSRRDASMSGAEYDPDRPLHGMLSGAASKISAFDIEPSRSRYAGYGSVDGDPLVAEGTGELDRILQSGNVPTPRQRSVRVCSPHPSATSSGSDSEVPPSRPKLSDALRQVSFSPQRPRNASSRHLTPSPESSTASDEKHSPQRQRIQRASHSSAYPHHRPSPLVTHLDSIEVPPQQAGGKRAFPTSSSRAETFGYLGPATSSKLTVLNSDHGGEVDGHRKLERQGRPNDGGPPIIHVQSASGDSLSKPSRRNGSSARDNLRRDHDTRNSLHLPDVTGLTMAVDSPARPGVYYYPYKGDNNPREVEERLLSTLGTVQTKLHQLEDENSISRRRVRELEMELEVCKREVARERTRVLEREDQIVQHQRDLASATAATKGKAKADADLSASHERYKEAVEEKKALEALINTLRAHLARLTAELSSHQQLLTELRNLRDADAQTMRDKAADVDRLKEEVERLAGEIEVLRGVVEEGLKERRSMRESSELQPDGGGFSEVLLNQDVQCGLNASQHAVIDNHGQHPSDQLQPSPELPASEDEGQFRPEQFSPQNLADRTMRTDRATLASSHLATSDSNSKRFVTTQDLERISAELEERRSERSITAASDTCAPPIFQPANHSFRVDPPTPSPVRRKKGFQDSFYQGDFSGQAAHAVSPLQSYRDDYSVSQPGPSQHPDEPARPAAPTPGHASRQRRRDDFQSPETPFPQIRGEHLERLFFSAPEHNEKTCTVCHRKRRNQRPSEHEQPVPALWSFPPRPSRRKKAPELNNEDEGFGEGSDSDHVETHPPRNKGKQREVAVSDIPPRWDPLRSRATQDKGDSPPQTILTRVIRELEDDFTHYKSIYVELADQYKDMDAVSNVPKRNLLAQHLREVVDILEQKGDQIASLYELLTFKDKPVGAEPSKSAPRNVK